MSGERWEPSDKNQSSHPLLTPTAGIWTHNLGEPPDSFLLKETSVYMETAAWLPRKYQEKIHFNLEMQKNVEEQKRLIPVSSLNTEQNFTFYTLLMF